MINEHWLCDMNLRDRLSCAFSIRQVRTTLSIDDDVLAAVHELAQARHTTAGRVLSDLARQALAIVSSTDDGEFFGFRPLPKRGGVMTNELINAIRDEIGE